MGTESTDVLKNEIRRIIGLLGWSERRMAREIYYSINDIDNEDEVRQFEEKIKKSLQRKTTKAATLEGYLSVIMQHDEARKIDAVRLEYVPIVEDQLDHEALSAMKKISVQLEK